jgi:hypothetical protein
VSDAPRRYGSEARGIPLDQAPRTPRNADSREGRPRCAPGGTASPQIRAARLIPGRACSFGCFRSGGSAGVCPPRSAQGTPGVLPDRPRPNPASGKCLPLVRGGAIGSRTEGDEGVSRIPRARRAAIGRDGRGMLPKRSGLARDGSAGVRPGGTQGRWTFRNSKGIVFS